MHLHLLVICANLDFSDEKLSSKSNKSSAGPGSSRKVGGNTCSKQTQHSSSKDYFDKKNNNKQQNWIESLQRRATKFILNTHWQEDISHHDRLSRLNLLPLTYLHEVKVTERSNFFISSVAQTSTPYPQMIMLSLKALVSLATALIPKSRTELFQFSHFNSIQTRIIWILCLNPLALLLLLRYSAAFPTNYDVNNFNTWKSIYWKSWSLALLFVPHHRYAFLYFFSNADYEYSP